MPTKRTATRRTSVVAASEVTPVAPAPASVDAGVCLLFTGGADLSFRDGSGTKRRALRGVPFVVDAVTATILQLDPTVSPFVEVPEPDGHSAALIRPGMTTVTIPVDGLEGVGVIHSAEYVDLVVIAEEPAPGDPPPTDPGPIVLGDLPASARLSS
jgi:hypothetical protein